MIIPGWLYNLSPHYPLDTRNLANPSPFLLSRVSPHPGPLCILYPRRLHVTCCQHALLWATYFAPSPLFLFILSLPYSHLHTASLFYLFYHFHLYPSLSPFIHIQCIYIQCLSLSTSSRLSFSLPPTCLYFNAFPSAS
ncbi:uncharacterized protein BO96DRAFT_247947 [Aspergillus niger CBS 101883]|uniref:uncharacterized protein n=1 Tax=Aspergillus lacticoffeatus (strain CBS 101883) TaxID=1450533 RepID=UPI000D7F894F|nr:uncharacterized protein BO96DRAFT_247947 [Aspergillus niger CBS 101883]PYH58736.1 hypothetical protein BO96DRAFT_247947 [Aspergillus niger CBS 101883]